MGEARPLPVDSDLDADETPDGRPAPVRLGIRHVALVGFGGAVGTAARELITLAVPGVHGIPVATIGINVTGAFLLGVLLEAIARDGADSRGRRTIRLLFGTGMLGGFTTYSALATDAVLLANAGLYAAALGYALGTVVVGALASWAGIAVAAARGRAS